MRIPPYWSKERYEGTDHKGHAHVFVACGWSFASLKEAKDEARARAKRVFDLVTRGQKPASYEYLDRPIREEIVQEVTDGATQVGIITRNRYGALILNTGQVLFVDVDFPKAGPSGLFEALAMLFSRKKREAKRQAAIQGAIDGVRQWAENHPSRSFRQYRTREGLRLLFTDKLYDPTSEETASVFRELKSDPLYVKLTQKQECFRARLTAKPWRCGCPRPPTSFPWSDPEAEKAFRQWEADYTRKDAEHRACELMSAFGNMADIAALKTVVGVHDRGSRIESDAPLA